MAESRVRRNQAGNLDFNSDTPVPAAEVLIDLRESAKRRRALQKVRTSPRKKGLAVEAISDSPKKPPNLRTSSRRLDFSADSSGLHNNHSVSGSSEEEEEEEEEVVVEKAAPLPVVVEATPPRKSRRLMGRTHGQITALNSSVKHPRPNQAILHSVSSRLRNLLKLHKAHKWCYYEWFYSDIDQPLLEGENDFCRCLADMFPGLKTRQLTRVQWRQLRRLMGKPRRCSPTFFAEERALLEFRRKKVRHIQQQVHQGVITVPDFSAYKDIPNEIPALLVVGTKVTARLNDKGYFTGRIEAVDLENHRYWVTFMRPGLGKHAVPDTEIRSSNCPEMISISMLEETQRVQWRSQDPHHFARPKTPPRPILPDTPAVHALFSPDSHVDPFLTSSPARRKMLIDPPSVPGLHPQSPMPHSVGGFPIDFLRHVTQLSKLLSLKQQRVQRLTEMNTEAEKLHARQRPMFVDFQRRYAAVIIDLDDINKQLNMRLESIRSHCESLGYGSEIGPPMNAQEHALKITDSANSSLEASGSEVKDSRLLDLIANLTSLLLQIESLSESGNAMEMGSLTQSVEEIEAKIHPENRKCFQDNVETPVTLIQSGMNPIGTLHAFSVGTASPRTHHRGGRPNS